MSNGKKGLGPIAWVAIGCGGLLLILGIVAIVGLGWVGSKAKSFIEESENNPALVAAKIIAMTNPDIEVVDADESSETIAFRNTKTGEEWSVDYEDVQEGRWSFTKDGETVTYDAADSASDVTVTRSGAAGEASTIRLGGSDASDLPEWAPIYPGAEVQPGFRSASDEEVSGLLNLTVQDSAAEVLAWYKGTLEGAGYKVEVTEVTSSAAGVPALAIIKAKNSDEGREVNVTVRGDASPATVMVQYSGAP